MFRKSVILATIATLMAAGGAMAEQRIAGTVTRVDVPNGNIWLQGGREFGVGTKVAQGLLPGDKVAITFTDYDRNIDVLSTSPQS